LQIYSKVNVYSVDTTYSVSVVRPHWIAKLLVNLSQAAYYPVCLHCSESHLNLHWWFPELASRLSLQAPAAWRQSPW